jgi:hypothetical protein
MPNPEPNATQTEIKPRDEAILGWYFGPGQLQFHRSTFGAQLERARTFGHDSEACVDCCGTGFTCSGARLTQPEDDDTCPRCWGAGVIARRRRNGERGPRPGQRWEDYLVARENALTARPTAELRIESGIEPDHETLMRMARVVKRLARVDPRTKLVLLAYYGDVGERWARTKLGRVLALYPLTPAGLKLLRMGEERSVVELPPHERIATEASNQLLQPKIVRGKLLVACRDQSKELLVKAAIDWNESRRRK